YFRDAMLLVSGKDFMLPAAQRPLFAGLLAVALRSTDLNLKLVLVFLTALVSVAAFFFSRQVVGSFGRLAGFRAVLVTFLFYRRFFGSLMTENLGLSLGLLGCALLLHSLQSPEYGVTVAAYAVFVLTMALIARAGAFLVLPAILLYFWVNGRQRASILVTRNWRLVLAGCLGIGLAFGCNVLVRQWTGSTNTVPFGNGAASFYGMAAGYKGSGQTLIDHPELKDAQGAQPIYTITGHAFAMIRQHPLQLIKAVLLSFPDFFVRLFGFAKLNFIFEDLRAHLTLNLIIAAALNGCLFL